MKTSHLMVGESFHRGLVLYRGEEAVPFGRNMHAVPIDWLRQIVDKKASD